MLMANNTFSFQINKLSEAITTLEEIKKVIVDEGVTQVDVFRGMNSGFKGLTSSALSLYIQYFYKGENGRGKSLIDKLDEMISLYKSAINEAYCLLWYCHDMDNLVTEDNGAIALKTNAGTVGSYMSKLPLYCDSSSSASVKNYCTNTINAADTIYEALEYVKNNSGIYMGDINLTSARNKLYRLNQLSAAVTSYETMCSDFETNWSNKFNKFIEEAPSVNMYDNALMDRMESLKSMNDLIKMGPENRSLLQNMYIAKRICDAFEQHDYASAQEIYGTFIEWAKSTSNDSADIADNYSKSLASVLQYIDVKGYGEAYFTTSSIMNAHLNISGNFGAYAFHVDRIEFKENADGTWKTEILMATNKDETKVEILTFTSRNLMEDFSKQELEALESQKGIDYYELASILSYTVRDSDRDIMIAMTKSNTEAEYEKVFLTSPYDLREGVFKTVSLYMDALIINNFTVLSDGSTIIDSVHFETAINGLLDATNKSAGKFWIFEQSHPASTFFDKLSAYTETKMDNILGMIDYTNPSKDTMYLVNMYRVLDGIYQELGEDSRDYQMDFGQLRVINLQYLEYTYSVNGHTVKVYGQNESNTEDLKRLDVYRNRTEAYNKAKATAPLDFALGVGSYYSKTIGIIYGIYQVTDGDTLGGTYKTLNNYNSIMSNTPGYEDSYLGTSGKEYITTCGALSSAVKTWDNLNTKKNEMDNAYDELLSGWEDTALEVRSHGFGEEKPVSVGFYSYEGHVKKLMVANEGFCSMVLDQNESDYESTKQRIYENILNMDYHDSNGILLDVIGVCDDDKIDREKAEEARQIYLALWSGLPLDSDGDHQNIFSTINDEQFSTYQRALSKHLQEAGLIDKDSSLKDIYNSYNVWRD